MDPQLQKSYFRLTHLFKQNIMMADQLSFGVDQEAFTRDLREIFDIIINNQSRDESFLE